MRRSLTTARCSYEALTNCLVYFHRVLLCFLFMFVPVNCFLLVFLNDIVSHVFLFSNISSSKINVT